MSLRVSVIIPAYNEAPRIAASLCSVREALDPLCSPGGWELIVVDDGSRDATAAVAGSVDRVRLLRHPANRGKGAALETGLRAAQGEFLLLLDGDLQGSSGQCRALLDPVIAGEADMTVATLPAAGTSGGFGIANRLARWGVRRLTGRTLQAPLSGQRAMTRAVWARLGSLAAGYGAEVGLDVDVLNAGFTLLEVPTQMTHRAAGRNLAGFRHRGRQLVAIGRALLERWRRG